MLKLGRLHRETNPMVSRVHRALEDDNIKEALSIVKKFEEQQEYAKNSNSPNKTIQPEKMDKDAGININNNQRNIPDKLEFIFRSVYQPIISYYQEREVKENMILYFEKMKNQGNKLYYSSTFYCPCTITRKRVLPKLFALF